MGNVIEDLNKEKKLPYVRKKNVERKVVGIDINKKIRRVKMGCSTADSMKVHLSDNSSVEEI